MHYIINLIAAVDAHPLQMPEGNAIIPIVLFALLMLAILFGSILGWTTIIAAKIAKFPLPLRFESHNPPPWGMVDVLAIIGFWFLTQIATGLSLRYLKLVPPPAPDAAASQTSLWTMALVQGLSVFAVVAGTIWLISWFKSQSQFAGWSVRHILYDIVLGAAVFVLCAPMLYGLMALATLVTERQYNHPLIEAINKDPSNIILAFWVAVISAPIVEEFGFRVLLQGFLQSLAERSSLSKLLIAIVGRGRVSGETAPMPENGPSDQSANLGPEVINTFSVPTKTNPYMPPSAVDPQPHVGQTYQAPTQPIASVKIWPILLSGTLFGLAHFDYGASWIPLVFFGCVLGWLYQKTNRIWPSLTAHMFCNFIGVSGILLQSLYGTPPT
jgi:membrane protease YdiL (CAAX protease family)